VSLSGWVCEVKRKLKGRIGRAGCQLRKARGVGSHVLTKNIIELAVLLSLASDHVECWDLPPWNSAIVNFLRSSIP
jgi:hypothetical protein